MERLIERSILKIGVKLDQHETGTLQKYETEIERGQNRAIWRGSNWIRAREVRSQQAGKIVGAVDPSKIGKDARELATGRKKCVQRFDDAEDRLQDSELTIMEEHKSSKVTPC